MLNLSLNGLCSGLSASVLDCKLLEAKTSFILGVHTAEHTVTLHKLQIMSDGDGPYFLLPSILLLFTFAQNKCQRGDIRKGCGSSSAQHVLSWSLIHKRGQQPQHFRKFYLNILLTYKLNFSLISKTIHFILHFIKYWYHSCIIRLLSCCSKLLCCRWKQGFKLILFWFSPPCWISSSFQTWSNSSYSCPDIQNALYLLFSRIMLFWMCSSSHLKWKITHCCCWWVHISSYCLLLLRLEVSKGRWGESKI